ncbi:MAG: transcriptional regulator [Actinobacteria bacterium]|nr:transcriptional regulator [Actinomycetota bacterium]
MKFFRVGDKVLSREKLITAIEKILAEREAGATQEEVARSFGVQRTFISFLESLGEIRRGPKVALVGFPVANPSCVEELGERKGLDMVLVFSQEQRENIETEAGYDVFNRLLETLAALREFDVVLLLASDWRIELMKRVLGAEVIGIPLGSTPLRSDVEVDLGELERVIDDVLSARARKPRAGSVSAALMEAAKMAERWSESRKS